MGALGSLGLASPAWAQEFPAPTKQDYTLDLYQGNAIGSAKIVGMGGVATAIAQGSTGMLTNPAAAGVRPTTSNDTWDWDVHFVTQTPSLGQDTDNNGIDDEDVDFRPSFTVGGVVQYKDWGLGATLLQQTLENSFSDAGEERSVRAQTHLYKFSFAHYLLDAQLVVGVGARIVQLTVDSDTGTDSAVELARLTGGSFESGVLWKPNGKSYRLGGTISLPVVVDDIKIDKDCDPLDCAGYVLPKRLRAPWVATLGFANRRAPTEWNQRVKSQWRDEKAFTWGVDLVITGTTTKGYGLEAFGQHQLQPSGRKTSVSLRGGVEYEWYPGTLRVRGGGYYEPSRFKDTEGKNIPGRVHTTLGLDWAFWSFQLWSNKYRPQLSVWADAAEKYGVTGISIGFWH